ncbi:reverse transcriptase domain-containing protein [Leeuwenhoekiella marinoflava]|uniref:Reverse transcriptase (RNA-dependent DNA polymerase) n=2 Tax=Leeuwenhoekiella marinoflava TaxID=988 RepID=A0A4Q0PLV8_9FLAO|nr:reverse transcriptase domain-containing protein [Leeuwenhoekiella marinoflava]RXG30668.1 reverse transcriptase (RNA-dependent DNA polymerase) [Leeuwenhoekiella marinoflava]SHF20213.1 Reverse transcriptase (RNA-dependent DNA polymerase) [Leeuwenhoekiella marinoflava DSM 3653]
MKKKEEHPWIKFKKYPHIGFPLERKDTSKLEGYIMDENKVAKHSFLPFLHRTIFQRKFRANTKGLLNKSKKRTRVKGKPKAREIYFASHFDAQIYSYYSYLLSKKYNDLLKTKSFDKSIVAYRKIEIKGKKNKNKCNIDFALETFQFIKDNQDKELTVIVADVTKFFDSLDHKILKQKWAEVWDGSITLPKDHFRVYKSLIDMRYVNEDLLFRNYKDEIWVKTKTANDPKTNIKRQKPIKHKRFLKDNNAIAFCEKADFLKNSLHLISKSNAKKGIPQGTALSATLANIYLLDFDQEVQDYVDGNSIKGFYQRYSDDLIIVVPRDKQEEAIKRIRFLVEDKAKLEIHPDKTKVYHFHQEDGKFKGIEVDENTGKEKNKKLEYLGFEYDGQRALIKTAGYSKFNRSMKRAFKRVTSLTINADTTDDKIHKSSLFKRFTYKGAKRRQIYNGKTKTTRYDWGNYLSYVEKANASFFEFNNGNQIKKQSRKSWRRFNELMVGAIKKIEIFKNE